MPLFCTFPINFLLVSKFLFQLRYFYKILGKLKQRELSGTYSISCILKISFLTVKVVLLDYN